MLEGTAAPAWRAAGNSCQRFLRNHTDAIRVQAFALTARPAYRQDFRLHAQTEDAIQSVCRNIAEGFGADSHREFRRFLIIVRRSLNELLDSLRSAQLKHHACAEDPLPIHALARRLYAGLASLIRHLERCHSHRPGS